MPRMASARPLSFVRRLVSANGTVSSAASTLFTRLMTLYPSPHMERPSGLKTFRLYVRICSRPKSAPTFDSTLFDQSSPIDMVLPPKSAPLCMASAAPIIAAFIPLGVESAMSFEMSSGGSCCRNDSQAVSVATRAMLLTMVRSDVRVVMTLKSCR